MYVEILPAGNCRVLKLDAGARTFRGNNMLRVTIEGDIDENGNGVVVGLSGGKADGRIAVSMVFKHEDFIVINE